MVRLLTVLVALLLPFGGLYVNSLPSGAYVWVDGTYIGRTPLLIDGLRAGKHALTITKAGWRVDQFEEEVTAGIVTPVTVQLGALNLPSGTGTLVLDGLAKGARVSIDGGKTAAPKKRYSIAAGSHRIVVHEPQAEFKRSVVVYAGQTTHVLLRPAARTHSAIVAPLSDYMPASAATVAAGRVVVRWGGHVAVGHLGDAQFLVDGRKVVYDAPAGLVRGQLYLPLDLILALTRTKAK